MKNSRMTDVIYDYFTSRILFGYFQQGDQLPSVNYICRQFQVSALTVRSVLARMRQEGYIETTERRNSTVTYRPDERQEQLYRYTLLSRKEGMDDMCRNSEILFEPISRFYLQKQTKESIEQIRYQMKKRKGHPAKQIIMFYAEAMRPMNNPLALNLYWEMVRYLRTPYLQRPANFEDASAQAEDHIEQMLLLIEAGNTAKAVESMQIFNKDVTQRFFQSLSIILDIKQPVEQIPFQWQVYWDHPQLCYTLAAEMMSKIDAGKYQEDKLLPSCQSLAQEFGVSLITMRRTLELLNDISVIETQNGLGARVISWDHASLPNYSHPQIRKSLLLFLQAMQISTLTCKNVAAHTLSSLDDEGFQTLERRMEHHIKGRRAFLIGGICLRFIWEKSPSAFIREVYRQLYHLLLWGHALHIFCQQPATNQLNEVYYTRLKEALHRRDGKDFSSGLSELMEFNFQSSRNLLLKFGFSEDQLV